MLQGERDKGILTITTHGVCHKPSDDPVPYTAFVQQYTDMRKMGIQKPNPRRQILKDIIQLIEMKHQLWY